MIAKSASMHFSCYVFKYYSRICYVGHLLLVEEFSIIRNMQIWAFRSNLFSTIYTLAFLIIKVLL